MQYGQAFIENLELKNALYIPSFSLSLVSVSKLELQGISVIFNANSCHIYNTTTKETIVNTVSTNGLSYIDNTPSSFAAVTTKPPRLRSTLPKTSDIIAIWHRRGFLRWISESSLDRLWTAFTDYHISSISVVPSLSGKREMPGFSILTHELRSCPYDGLQLRSLRYRYFRDFRALLIAVTQPGWLVPIYEACGGQKGDQQQGDRMWYAAHYSFRRVVEPQPYVFCVLCTFKSNDDHRQIWSGLLHQPRRKKGMLKELWYILYHTAGSCSRPTRFI
jgi:hypothetical protein